MKRLLLVLLLIPSLAFGAFTEFYCQNGGSNLNAGSTNNNTAAYTSTSGNWNTTTRVFTPTDGSTPASTVNVGDFASVYINGASVGVYIGRITAVGAGVNGTITVPGTNSIGASPANQTGTATIKVGGAWAGGSGTSFFPFNLSANFDQLNNTNGDQPRVNLKNDQTYAFTGAATFTNASGCVIQGYTTNPGDGGKASITNNSSSGTFTVSASFGTYVDLTFTSTASSGTATLVSVGGRSVFMRCVFNGARGPGLLITSGTTYIIECEAFDCDKSNSASLPAIGATGGEAICINTYSHDHSAGSNCDAYGVTSGGSIVLINSIADSSGGNGVNLLISGGPSLLYGFDAYNNTGDGIKAVTSVSSRPSYLIIRNSNFIKNGGKAINMQTTGGGGFSDNNGYGAGTQANGSADQLKSMVESGKVTYANDVAPYAAPTTGNFSLTVPSYGLGREQFTETDGTNSGTVGYPDIGAAQHNDTCGGTGPCQTSGASAY